MFYPSTRLLDSSDLLLLNFLTFLGLSFPPYHISSGLHYLSLNIIILCDIVLFSSVSEPLHMSLYVLEHPYSLINIYQIKKIINALDVAALGAEQK